MDVKEALRMCRRPNAKVFIVKQSISDLTKQATATTSEIMVVEYHNVVRDNDGFLMGKDCKKQTTD